jgi:hypothetical protein
LSIRIAAGLIDTGDGDEPGEGFDGEEPEDLSDEERGTDGLSCHRSDALSGDVSRPSGPCRWRAARSSAVTRSVEPVNIRDYATGKHRSMSMTRRRAGVRAWCSGPMCWRAAIDAVSPEGDTRPRLLMSPRGRPLTQKPACARWRTDPAR